MQALDVARASRPAGLTEDHIASTHREQLEATRTIHATRDGQITDTMEVPDNQDNSRDP